MKLFVLCKWDACDISASSISVLFEFFGRITKCFIIAKENYVCKEILLLLTITLKRFVESVDSTFNINYSFHGYQSDNICFLKFE